MENEIELLKFIEKQDSIFSAAKYFGGMEAMKVAAKNNPELLDLIKYSTKGYLTFKSDDRKFYVFHFYVKDFSIDEEIHLYVTIDLILKRSVSEKEEIGIWVDSYCEDSRPEYFFNDSLLRKYQYVLARVESVNGYNIPEGSRLEDMSNILSDDEAERILKEDVTGHLKKLQMILK